MVIGFKPCAKTQIHDINVDKGFVGQHARADRGNAQRGCKSRAENILGPEMASRKINSKFTRSALLWLVVF